MLYHLEKLAMVEYLCSVQLFFQKVRHIKQLPVDMNAIKDGLSSLMAPSQKPMFSPHMYAEISV